MNWPTAAPDGSTIGDAAHAGHRGCSRREQPIAAQAVARGPRPTTTRRSSCSRPSPHQAPVSALVASAQASRAQLSDTLAAIESELFGSTRPTHAATPRHRP